MKSLRDVRERMIELVGKPDKLGFINARLVLRTGITLNENDAATPQDLARVVAALKEMGYAIDTKEGRV